MKKLLILIISLLLFSSTAQAVTITTIDAFSKERLLFNDYQKNQLEVTIQF